MQSLYWGHVVRFIHQLDGTEASCLDDQTNTAANSAEAEVKDAGSAEHDGEADLPKTALIACVVAVVLALAAMVLIGLRRRRMQFENGFEDICSIATNLGKQDPEDDATQKLANAAN